MRQDSMKEKQQKQLTLKWHSDFSTLGEDQKVGTVYFPSEKLALNTPLVYLSNLQRFTWKDFFQINPTASYSKGQECL
jgi:hypothetical protein